MTRDPMAPPPAVLFDLDGVLVDSRTPIAGSLKRSLTEHGHPSPTTAELERFIGPPLAEVLSELIGEPADSAAVAAVVATYREHYAPASLTQTEVVAGIEPVLAALSTVRPLAVATSKPRRFAQPLLVALHLRRFFVAVCGPGEGAETVPKAATVAEALQALGNPVGAVMVGDRRHDVAGAHANGIAAIGVLWGIGDRTELLDAGADLIVERPEQLLDVLQEATTGIEPV